MKAGIAKGLAVWAAVLAGGTGVSEARNIREISGVKTIHVENPDLGLVFVQVVVTAGALLDPPGREGLANLCASTLLRGTRTRSYARIMDQVNDLGASLDASAQKEVYGLAGDFMPRHQDAYVEVLADVLANPTFEAGEFEHERSLILEDIRNLRNDDAELAGYFFARYLYRDHPLGRPTTGYLESVTTVTPEDCREFHKSHLRKGNLIVVLAGSIDEAGVERFVRTVTTGIPEGPAEVMDMPKPGRGEGLRVLVVDKPDRTQTQVCMGHPSLAWNDPDLFPLMVGNTAFGGTFTARLMQEIREKRGWSYGASSSISAGRQFGTFSIRFYPATKDTVPAIRLALDLVKDLAAKGLTRDEVAFSRDHLANQFPFRIETARKQADEKLADLLYGRPPRFIEDYVRTVRAQAPEAVNAALARWVVPDRMTIVVVGTAKDLEGELRKIPGVKELVVVPYDSDRLPKGR
jgi:zinc protease